MWAILLRLRTDKGVTVILIDTPSQSVRSSFQLAEPEPIRVSVVSLRNMSGERKYHASTFNPARRIAEAPVARRSRWCRRNDLCWLLLGWLVARGGSPDVVLYPDVAPCMDSRFDCRDLLQRSVIHYGAERSGAFILAASVGGLYRGGGREPKLVTRP